MNNCKICPFECGVDRVKEFGVCGLSNRILVSHVQKHYFEEPFISGLGGSGTVFFTGCNGKCVFCQNWKISCEWKNSKYKKVSFEELFEICSELIDSGVHNINFVSPTPYSELLREFLLKYKKKIKVPIVWNSGGYEKAETIRSLKGLVDVYLPDFKYFYNELAVKYSSMPNYFEYASNAIYEMFRQVGWPKFGKDGMIKNGLVIRHLVLPSEIENSKKVLDSIFKKHGKKAYVALMSQYYPAYKASKFNKINRTLTKNEHEEIHEYFINLGFDDGLTQELEAANGVYTPEFWN